MDFLSSCFETVLRREMTHRPHLQHVLWVHGLRLRSCPMLCLSWCWVEDTQSSEWWKQVSVTLKGCFALRPSRRTSQTKSNAMRMRSTFLANSRSRCLCQDGTFQTSASTCYTSFLMSLQDGKWIREEKMSESVRDTSKPGTWCFVFSASWTMITCWVFVCNLWSCLALRTDCYGFTIPST